MGDTVKDKFPVGFYFSCNSQSMMVQSFCNLFERPAVPQQLFDNKAIGNGDMFLLSTKYSVMVAPFPPTARYYNYRSK